VLFDNHETSLRAKGQRDLISTRKELRRRQQTARGSSDIR
jgi:hypothetical protein